MLCVRLFGELDVRLDDAPLPVLQSPRARSLLAYLLLHRHAPQPRQRLAFVLWPDSTEAQARTNLRHLLHTLRRAVPELLPYIETGTHTLQWRSGSDCWLDVAAFEAALDRAEREPDAATSLLREALAHYRGELLPGCYDEWIEPVRDRLRRRYRQALERLAAQLATEGNDAAALGFAEELFARDPLDEFACRLLMRLHAGRGEHGRALRVYRTCEHALERELGGAPSPETRRLRDALLPPGDPLLPHGDALLPHGIAPAASAAPAARTAHATPVPPAATGEVPFVGRVGEWERLTALWRGCEQGRSALAFVTGEAGIGKTRLVAELAAWSARRGARIAEARCYSFEDAVAYAPIAAWLRTSALRPGLDRLTAGEIVEVARLLPELRRGGPDLPPPERLSAADQRARLFAAASRALLGTGKPLLLVLDDVQWCDRDSLRLVHHLLRTAASTPLLLAATARQGELVPGHPLVELLLAMEADERVVQIELARFVASETAALAAQLSPRRVGRDEAARLHAVTEGNPLFVVEAVRVGWSGRPGEPVRSAKIDAVLRQRLAQLTPAARQVAGLAATIGREFTVDVLTRASGMAAEPLVAALDELWRTHIVRAHAAQSYDFSHDSLRVVAYDALSPVRRAHNHDAVARALAEQPSSDVAASAAAIAGHYERAGSIDEALAWYERAAETAERLHAEEEAVRLLSRALELLGSLPDTESRLRRELALLTALLTPIAVVEGFGAPRLHTVQQRSLELVRTLQVEAPAALDVSRALTSLSRDDFDTARSLGEQLQARAQGGGDEALALEAAYLLGIAAFWQGQLETARSHFEAAVAAGRPTGRRARLLRPWLDPQVVCASRLANTRWFLGDEAGAIAARDAALALAAELGDQRSRSVVHTFAALLAVEMDDLPNVRRFAAALDPEAAPLDGSPMRVGAGLLRAYLLAVDGQPADGIATLERALDSPDGAGQAPGMRAVIGRLLLAAHVAAGEAPGQLAAAERLIAMGGAARLWEAEARRVRAECQAALGASARAVETELLQAVALARSQGARMLERRALASLVACRNRGWNAPGTPAP